jgi:hypothetical protein
LQRAYLLAHRGTVDRNDAEAATAGVRVDRLGHLHRQLARAHEDETAHAPTLSGSVR